jgi:colicin import membrane protein
MSHTLDYQEPHRFSAGLLALTVHVAFFALLIVGVRWQSQAPEDFVVELWSTMPTVTVVPEQAPAQPVVEPAPAVKVEPPQPVKADIELREKKVKDAEAKEKQRKRDEEIAKAAAAAAARQEAERRELEAYAAQRAQAVQANVRAEMAAAAAAEVGRYTDMIRSKIRRNIVMPPDVPESAVAEFKVTLLPDGSVMEAELLKSSGNPAYDDAAERAIYKAQPLPLPQDAGLQKKFRELRLTIRP